MPFRFPLQSVLHLHQSLEHQHEMRLHAANQQVLKVLHWIAQLDHSIQDLRQETSREIESGTRSAAMIFAFEIESKLHAQHRELERELSRVTQIRDHERQAFEQASRERHKLEILRDRDAHQYRIQQNRREQRTLDESFLLNQSFRKRGQKLPG